MSDYKQGSFDAAKFKDVFGLSSVDEDKAYSDGSSTGTKQVAALGTYLTKSDYNRLKNDDKVWDAYASVNGQDAADKKRESGAMSINTLDALMDDLSAKKPEEAEEVAPTEPRKPYAKSPELAHAEARIKTHEEDVWSGKYSSDLYDMDYKPHAAATNFLDRYRMNLGSKLADGLYEDPQDRERYNTEVTRQRARTNPSNVGSGENEQSLDAALYARSGSDNRKA